MYLTVRYSLLFCCLFASTIIHGQESNETHGITEGVFKNAFWISAQPGPVVSGIEKCPCPVFKKEFSTKKEIKKATLFITAHGLYEATINGHRVGNDYFTPGYTSYNKRLLYQEYDVSALLQKKSGTDKLEVTIGEGWYRGVFGGGVDRRNTYGSDASLLCKLVVEYSNGEKDSVVTDDSWQFRNGPISGAGLYFGETYDESKVSKDWNPVVLQNFPEVALVPYDTEPVTAQETFTPKRIFKNQKGETIIDFGQDMAGWVEVTIKGHKGDTITISHAQMVDSFGNLFIQNIRGGDAVDTYILDNDKIQKLHPHFTYHGFRYASIKGFEPNIQNCKAIAIHSNLRHTGQFSCSDTLINHLQHNIEWSLNANLFEIPTDCPQRDERLGWTGDAEIIFPTATFNRDLHRFFAKWMRDAALEQDPDGGIPDVIPDARTPLVKEKGGTAGWGDVATIIPMGLFNQYGDTALLKEEYPMMKRWVVYCLSHLHDSTGLSALPTYGDWYSAGPGTDVHLISQCYLVNSLDLLVKAQHVLQINEYEINFYKKALERARKSFATAFIKPDGYLSDSTQAAYVLALHFNLFPENLKTRAAAKLAQLIHQNNDHLSTGFLGTAFLLEVLSDYGYSDLAFKIIEQEDYPSWLYEVKKGATAIWERWDCMGPNGELKRCSFNQYAFGSVGDWLYSRVAGILALSPGYGHILIEPHSGGNLTWVSASYESKYGKIVSSWKIENGKFYLHTEVPHGVSATVRLPDGQSKEVSDGSFDFQTTLKN